MWRVEADTHFAASQHFFRERLNPFESFSDPEFFERYRFYKDHVVELLDIVGPALERPTRR